NAVADLLRSLESDTEINRIARNLATAAERNDRVSNLVALDRVYLTGRSRGNLLFMLRRRQRSELAALRFDHFVKFFQRRAARKFLLQHFGSGCNIFRRSSHYEHLGRECQGDVDKV